jgi:hypothetical protein
MITVLNFVMVTVAVAACALAAGLTGCSRPTAPPPASESAVSPVPYRAVAHRPPFALVEMGDLRTKA